MARCTTSYVTPHIEDTDLEGSKTHSEMQLVLHKVKYRKASGLVTVPFEFYKEDQLGSLIASGLDTVPFEFYKENQLGSSILQ